MWVPPPHHLNELARAEQRERETRLALRAAQQRALDDREYAPPEDHHELIRKLEADWKHALEHLHRTRKAAEE